MTSSASNLKNTMRFLILSVSVAALSTLFYTCREADLAKGERLAETHCASCHLFPEPSLLDKKTWEHGVMPEMAFRMGLDVSKMFNMSQSDMDAALKTMPGKTLSEEDFNLIKKYYQNESPDSLGQYSPSVEPLGQFQASLWKSNILQPTISIVKADSLTRSIWIGDRKANLFQFGYDLTLQDSFQTNSPVSSIIFKKSSNPVLLAMGEMDPSDLSIGSLVELQPDGSFITIIDSLNRPVSFEVADLNNDGLQDYVICSFGNYTGSLQIYQNLGKNVFRSHTLSHLPGARKVIVKDFDNNGWLDVVALITQGDEQIQLFLNSGGFQFRLVTLLRFTPVYGSSYFEMADMNADGKADIIYSNGDNADYSQTLKPYHGIRIFINEGGNEFKESWFHPMHGASQTVVKDFDRDGDMDIAAISFFPDFSKPENGFLYFENEGKGLSFSTYATPLAGAGRWLRMESLDLEGDGDQDLLLCALNFDIGVKAMLREKWKNEKVPLLILMNSQSR
jgi:FG-GAP-like repeat